VEPSEGGVMADPDSPLIAYPPIKLIIKLERPDNQQEENSVEEENWLHQVYYYFSLFLYIVFYIILLLFKLLSYMNYHLALQRVSRDGKPTTD